jgi:adenosylcobyric acid synthase
MLGESISDPHGVESMEVHVRGLGLLALRTHFEREKVTAQVRARVAQPSFLTNGTVVEEEIQGYEIHMGMVELRNKRTSLFDIRLRNGRVERRADGALSGNGMVVGTMLHGLFENEVMRDRTLSFLRTRKGLPTSTTIPRIPTKQAEYDRVEAVVREHLDCEMLRRLTGLYPVSPM